MSDLERLWTECADALRLQVSDATWRTWFAGVAPISLDGQRLVLGVPNTMVRDRLETRYRGLVTETVTDTLGAPYDVVLEVHAGVDRPPRPPSTSSGRSPAKWTRRPTRTAFAHVAAPDHRCRAA